MGYDWVRALDEGTKVLIISGVIWTSVILSVKMGTLDFRLGS